MKAGRGNKMNHKKITEILWHIAWYGLLGLAVLDKNLIAFILCLMLMEVHLRK